MDQTIQNSQNTPQTDGHILVVCCPFQGHAAPLMKLSHQISKCGAKVTFLTTDITNAPTASAVTEPHQSNEGIRIISVPDGLKLEDRNDQVKLYESVHRVMPSYFEDLLKKTNQSPKTDDRISGVIIDSPLAWMMGIPKKMGLKIAVYWCSTPGCLALGLKIPQLIESKFLDGDGTPLKKNEKIHLLPHLLPMSTTELMWYFPGDTNIQKSIFHVTKDIIHHMENADWILCNWFNELDPPSSNITPNLLPIGPLLSNGQSTGSFYSEDSTCLVWLDKQPKNSVVYVAFGSTSRFSQHQLAELASGLEFMGRPFLWVAWSGLSGGSHPAYTDEFVERVAGRGKMVEWAPQEAILGHPSVACFITHCGWGSVMEALSSGVPLVCWPYFGDQLYTQTCVCDAWKVGVRLKPDESGVVSGSEIKQKVEELLSEWTIRENALRLKGMARRSITEGGSSLVNLEYVVQQMKC